MSGPLIRPFTGYIPRSDLIAEVVAPPVSSITADRYQQLVADNPTSVLHLVGSAIDTGAGGPDPALFDQQAAARLEEMIDAGVFEPQPQAFYVLMIETGEVSAAGIVCEVNTEAEAAGRLKRHEHTRSETEELVLDHLRTVRAHTDPVAMTYRSQPEIETAIKATIGSQQPIRSFTTDDGSRLTLWAATGDEAMGKLEESLVAVPAVYITDGHHRTAAASRLRQLRRAENPNHRGDEPYNYILTVLFAETQLTLHGFNRAVTDLAGLDVAAALERIKAVAELEEISVAWAADARPRRRGVVAMRMGGRWYRLTFREENIPDDPRGSLDAVLLQNLILGPIFGITDARADNRLHYIPGPAGLAELERREAAASFALYPASVADVMAIADRGEVMPPKSTWFSPKVPTGLVIRKF